MRLQTPRAIVALFCALFFVCGCSEIDTRIELMTPLEENGEPPSFVGMYAMPHEPTAIIISAAQDADQIIERYDLHHLYLVAHDCNDADAFESIAAWYPESNERRVSVADNAWVERLFDLEVDPLRYYYVAVVPNRLVQNDICLQLRAGAMWGLGRLNSTQMRVNR